MRERTLIAGGMVLAALAAGVASCTLGAAAHAQAQPRPSIAGCGTVAIVRADRGAPARLEAQAKCFERAAEIATAAAAERRALLTPAPAPTPTPPPALPSADWRRCAVEDGVCSFEGRAVVRYGARETFVERMVDGTIPCTNAAFGGDPVYGIPKACDVRGVGEAPAPAPTPTPTPAPQPDTSPPPAAGLDPAALQVEWAPRFRALGYEIAVGPRRAVPSIAKPNEHRWDIAMWPVGKPQFPNETLFYAVFGPPQGTQEGMETARHLVETYYARAQQEPLAAVPPAPPASGQSS